MRILFYIPAATPNWFTDLIAPLIRVSVEAGAEAHVAVTPLWQGTGIADKHLADCADLIERATWHVLDGPDHPSLRTRPENPEAIVALAQEIGADYTFCRSADITTPELFPGKVRYLMEGDFVPTLPASIPLSGRIMVTGPRLYDFGFAPDLGEANAAKLRQAIEPSWQALRSIAADSGDRASYLEKTGLPTGRPIIAVALQCQTPDNTFGQVHSSDAAIDEAIAQIVAADDDWFVAVSLHPIDRAHRNGGPYARIAAMDPDRVRIVDYPGERYRGEATERLVQHCDGLIVAESKAISLGTWFAKPILRLTSFATADWVNAYADLAKFRAGLASGTPATADPAAFRFWYAYHFANEAFVAAEASFEELIERADKVLHPGAWGRGIGRLNLQF